MVRLRVCVLSKLPGRLHLSFPPQQPSEQGAPTGRGGPWTHKWGGVPTRAGPGCQDGALPGWGGKGGRGGGWSIRDPHPLQHLSSYSPRFPAWRVLWTGAGPRWGALAPFMRREEAADRTPSLPLRPPPSLATSEESFSFFFSSDFFFFNSHH